MIQAAFVKPVAQTEKILEEYISNEFKMVQNEAHGGGGGIRARRDKILLAGGGLARKYLEPKKRLSF